MKVLAKLSFAMLLVGLFSTTAQAQILDRLERKVETKVERRVERKVDRSIDKGLDKAEDGIDDAATKKKEDKEKKEDENTQKADSSNTSMHWMQYREMRGSFEDLIDVHPAVLAAAGVGILPRRQG